MANSSRRVINYKPRMTDLEALDALPQSIRAALQCGPFNWCAYTAYRLWKKHGEAKTLWAVANRHADEFKTGTWERVPFKPSIKTPGPALKVPPMFSKYRNAINPHAAA